MRQPIFHLVLSLTLAVPAGLAAQTLAPHPAAPPATSGLPPSQIVQPAISNLLSVLDSVRIEKWKGAGDVRQRAEDNIGSVRRDLDSNLPSLLHVADGAPNSLPAVLPAARNLDALYDVVLRVAESAHSAAPRQQSADLDAALINLEQARRDLNARILTSAQSNESEMKSLRQQLATRAAAPPQQAPEPCPTPSTRKKHTVRKTAPTG